MPEWRASNTSSLAMVLQTLPPIHSPTDLTPQYSHRTAPTLPCLRAGCSTQGRGRPRSGAPKVESLGRPPPGCHTGLLVCSLAPSVFLRGHSSHHGGGGGGLKLWKAPPLIPIHPMRTSTRESGRAQTSPFSSLQLKSFSRVQHL